MFRKIRHTRRCVIPSTGGCEWSQNKVPISSV
nr:SOS response-associated peptidase [Faecalicatena contorta]